MVADKLMQFTYLLLCVIKVNHFYLLNQIQFLARLGIGAGHQYQCQYQQLDSPLDWIVHLHY